MTNAVIERHKQIAAALSRITGREITEPMVRAWVRRRVDPLPVKYFAGRPGCTIADLTAWAKRQDGAKRPRRAAG